MRVKKSKNMLLDDTVCTIEWSASLPARWEKLFSSVKKPTLLQSPPYIQAMAKLNRQQVRYGIILINGQDAGLVSILEAGIINNAVHAVILDRGPLWLDGFGSPAHFESFIRAFRAEFPKRFGRRIRFIPEVKNSPDICQLLREHEFQQQGKLYETIWLDCRADIEVLRQNLKKKWRYSLRKAEEENIDIKWNMDGAHLHWLMENHIKDQAQRNYQGVSFKTLIALISEFSRGQNLMVGTAVLDGEPIAAILIFIHGSGATYQVGYTNQIGREKAAHHLLLWDAVKRLKERNINDFDLGGVNDEDAKGVKVFKSGLGGKIAETPGLWV